MADITKVKAECLEAVDKATGETVHTQFIPPAPSGGDLGGISEEDIQALGYLKGSFVVDVSLYGCKCDARHLGEDGFWYSDSSRTVRATDDSDALQKLLNTLSNISPIIYIPRTMCLDKTVELRYN